MRDLSTKHLRAFVTTCDCGSITMAAEELGVTQPALSTTIMQAEELLGLKILDRSARRAKPSAAGELLLPEARRILADVSSTTNRLRDLAMGRTGQLSLAVLPSIVDDILAPVLSKFKATYPAIRISVRDALNADVTSLVRAGQVDLGIGAHSETIQDLEQSTIYEDRFIAVIPADHKLAFMPDLTWESLRGESFIGGALGSNTQAIVEQHLKMERNESTIECSFVPTTIGMVRHGLGVSVLSELACRPFREDRKIEFREIHPLVRRPIAIMRDPKRAPSAATTLFTSLF